MLRLYERRRGPRQRESVRQGWTWAGGDTGEQCPSGNGVKGLAARTADTLSGIVEAPRRLLIQSVPSVTGGVPSIVIVQWQSGHARACKARHTGSTPVCTSQG